MFIPERESLTPSESAVLTKAVVRAADLLEVGDDYLVRVIGLEQSNINNQYADMSGEDDTFQAAVLFVRMYRSLDAIVGGNASLAKRWLHGENLALKSRPYEKIQNVTGLSEVVDYLDARRAII